jgi:hypothetical protein
MSTELKTLVQELLSSILPNLCCKLASSRDERRFSTARIARIREQRQGLQREWRSPLLAFPILLPLSDKIRPRTSLKYAVYTTYSRSSLSHHHNTRHIRCTVGASCLIIKYTAYIRYMDDPFSSLIYEIHTMYGSDLCIVFSSYNISLYHIFFTYSLRILYVFFTYYIRYRVLITKIRSIYVVRNGPFS